MRVFFCYRGPSMKALNETRILAPAVLKKVSPMYGRLKLEFLFNQILICKNWFLLKGQNWYRIYKGLIKQQWRHVFLMLVRLYKCPPGGLFSLLCLFQKHKCLQGFCKNNIKVKWQLSGILFSFYHLLHKNKLAKLRRCVSRVHYAKKNFGKLWSHHVLLCLKAHKSRGSLLLGVH